MSEHEARLRVTDRRAGHVLASLSGAVTTSSATTVTTSLTKLLLKHGRVLLDVAQARLVWPPAPELFVTALAAAGGWPAARLVLVGADRHTTDRLHAVRVSASVPLARTEAEALELVELRPSRLLRSAGFPAQHSSIARAVAFVRGVGRAWELSGPAEWAASIVGELATEAVRPPRTGFRVVVVLETTRLRLSVRDHRPDPPAAEGPELGTIAGLSDLCGALRFDDGVSVWAVLRLPDPAAGVPGAARRRTGGPVTIRPRRRPDRPDGGGPADPAPAVERRQVLTYDPEQAHEILSSAYGPHTVALTGDRDHFRFAFSTVSTREFAVQQVAHSAIALSRFDPWDDLLVVAPRGGRLRFTAGTTTLDVAPGDVALLGAGADHEARWRDMDTGAVRLSAAAIARLAAEICDLDPATVRFDLSRPVSPRRARHWLALLHGLGHGVLDNDTVLASPLARATVFRQLATTLVETFPNRALDELRSPRPGPVRVEPSAVRRAVRYIDEHAGEDIGLGDIARAARVGPRALQLAFRRHGDVTPLGHLRRVRLERAHRDLLAADPTAGDTVATIASRWGFGHHGYFASSYRRIYGHSPGVTLRS